MDPAWSPLPRLAYVAEAGSFDIAVQPYLPLLSHLPRTVLLALESRTPMTALTRLYVESNPLMTITAFSLALMPLFFLAAEISRNYSQVDRVWGILPLVFTVHYAVWSHMANASVEVLGRVNLAATLFFLWGSRITFNYWRKGGYRFGEEDYRMQIIRKNLGVVGSTLMNIFFAATIQVFLLLCLSTPMYILLLSESVDHAPFSAIDILFGTAILLLIVTAGIADQEQWEYQTAKQRYQASGKASSGYSAAELRRGFLTSGLWSYSRHPNFACEQAVWVVFYLWSCSVTGELYNWSGIGAISYLIMFQGSTRFSEGISASKYKEYSKYQRQVGMLLPVPGCCWR